MRKLGLLVIVIILGLIIILLLKNDSEAPTLTDRSGTPEELADGDVMPESYDQVVESRNIDYTCEQGDVRLALSGENYEKATVITEDGEYDLERVVTASGAKYASADQSFIFWTQGEDAFIQQNGNTTYEECTEK